MELKPIKLVKKKAGNGFLSSFTVNIGVNEARECGFIDQEMVKIIDPKNNQIIITLKEKTKKEEN